MLETEGGPLEKLGNARTVLKTILDLGGVVAEASVCLFLRRAPTKQRYSAQLHPSAKLVVALCTKAWEVCIWRVYVIALQPLMLRFQ